MTATKLSAQGAIRVQSTEDLEMDGVDSETSQEYPDSSSEVEYGPRSVYHAARSEADTLESTRSLFDSDIDYTYIGGRRYCADYFLPNDEEELERWSLLHQVYFELLDNNLTTVPLVDPRRILDVGCGVGEWADEMGVLYPRAEVIGTDIAPLQSTSVPQNVFFEIDDAEVEGGWNWTQPFDFIHFRGMKGAFKDWNHVYSEAYEHLEPGGWIEILDYGSFNSLYETFKGNEAVENWYFSMIEAMGKSPRPFNADHLEPEALESLGFVDVTVETYDLPMGAWGDSKQAKTAALMFLKLQGRSIESLSLRSLYEWGGWDLDRIKITCAQALKQMNLVGKSPKASEGCAMQLQVLKGRRPCKHPYVAVSSNGKSENFPSITEADMGDSESVTTITKDNINGSKLGSIAKFNGDR